ncbi:MAG: tyrosine-type recombinase/integrase [Streptosporangiaceae bacterium]
MSREGPPKVTAGHEFPWAWAALWRRGRAVCCAATPQKGLVVEQELQKITSAARLGGAWTPRELRHSFVSILSAHDVRLEDISDLVGHSSTSVTETVYRHEIRPALTENDTGREPHP